LEWLLEDPLTCPTDSPPDEDTDVSLVCTFETVSAEAATQFTTTPINILKPSSTNVNCAAVNANRGKQTKLVTSLKPGAAVPQDCRWNPTEYPFTIPAVSEEASTGSIPVNAVPVDALDVTNGLAVDAVMAAQQPYVQRHPPPPPSPAPLGSTNMLGDR
jgi:hypothetical protein